MNSLAEPWANWARHPFAIWFSLALAILGVASAAARTYMDYSAVPESAPVSSEMDFDKPGLFDFHTGGYFPALAFREGINPYAPEMIQEYPTPRAAPTYSPVVFMLHVPFSYLSVTAADIAYFTLNLGLLSLLAYWSLTMSSARPQLSLWLCIFGLFAFSRAGHITLVSGYFTLQLVLGTVLALHYAKSTPWLSGVGMLLASGKPTYIIPLTVLMIARKNFQAVMIGLALSAVVAVAGMAWLASFSSFSEVIDGIHRGEALFHADDNETPENTWTRLDLIGMVAKVIHWKPDNKIYLLAMFGLLILPCLAIWKTTDREANSGATGLTAMIAALAILVTIYHNSYDSLLIAIPWVGVTVFGQQVCPKLSKRNLRWLSLLLAVPAVNYASTYKVRGLLGLENHTTIWNAVTSINGICLLVALVILIVTAIRIKPAKDDGNRQTAIVE